MVVVVLTAVADRFHGFCSSCMSEIAPGVFVSSTMNMRVRQQVWKVLSEWFFEIGGGSIVMTWRSKGDPGGMCVHTAGTPKRALVKFDGMVLVKR